ncbi:MAG: sulfotransferase [Alphaproteobacteria bacterium]|nr:sulfotransferase [Alphaproteobacteria bacterium]
MVAAVLFAAILEHSPEHTETLRLRGLALVRAGQAAQGLEPLRRARRRAPANPLSHLHYGIGLQEAGRPARAAALFRRAARMMPQSAAPWINFASALIALGQGKAARAAARRALRLSPDSAEAHYMLGLGEIVEDDLGAAQNAFLQAIRRQSGFAQAWVNLVLVLVLQGEIARALAAIGRGLAACPGNSALEAAQAGFALLRGEQDEVRARLRAIIERDPTSVAARLNLANVVLLDDGATEALTVLSGPTPPGRDGAHWRAHRALALMQLGRDDEARRELDAIPQPYGDAEILILWRRVNLARRAGDETAAERMAERMAQLASREGAALFEHRVIAHFDLARFHADRGRKAQAFGHWRDGHSLLSRLQPFSRAEHEAFIDASMEAYDADRLRTGARADNADRAPVFIVGMPRSGTTLLEQILAAHREVHGAGERVAVVRAVARLAGPPLRAGTARTAAALGPETLDTSARQFLSELHALAPEARLITDKMPANSMLLGFIATLLPGARVILCRRDPRDIGLSIFQHRFFGHHPYAHHLADLGWYMAQHERLMSHWRAVLPLPILEVELSDWVADFAGTLDRVLGFLGLAHDPACERFYEQDRRVRTASSQQVRQPINGRGLGRWRGYEAELAPLIAELTEAGIVLDAAAPVG